MYKTGRLLYSLALPNLLECAWIIEKDRTTIIYVWTEKLMMMTMILLFDVKAQTTHTHSQAVAACEPSYAPSLCHKSAIGLISVFCLTSIISWVSECVSVYVLCVLDACVTVPFRFFGSQVSSCCCCRCRCCFWCICIFWGYYFCVSWFYLVHSNLCRCLCV